MNFECDSNISKQEGVWMNQSVRGGGKEQRQIGKKMEFDLITIPEYAFNLVKVDMNYLLKLLEKTRNTLI
jgi:hypothetical protein